MLWAVVPQSVGKRGCKDRERRLSLLVREPSAFADQTRQTVQSNISAGDTVSTLETAMRCSVQGALSAIKEVDTHAGTGCR